MTSAPFLRLVATQPSGSSTPSSETRIRETPSEPPSSAGEPSSAETERQRSSEYGGTVLTLSLSLLFALRATSGCRLIISGYTTRASFSSSFGARAFFAAGAAALLRPAAAPARARSVCGVPLVATSAEPPPSSLLPAPLTPDGDRSARDVAAGVRVASLRLVSPPAPARALLSPPSLPSLAGRLILLDATTAPIPLRSPPVVAAGAGGPAPAVTAGAPSASLRRSEFFLEPSAAGEDGSAA
eukprot:5831306-Prymnesium_polylepis.1